MVMMWLGKRKKDECNHNPDDKKCTRGLKDHVKSEISKILVNLPNITPSRIFRKLVKKHGCDKDFDMDMITNFMKH